MNYKNKINELRTNSVLAYSHSFSNCIGLHRTKIKNLHIESIDLQRLLSTSACYSVDDSNYALTDDGVPFSYISKVRPSQSNEFKAHGYYKPSDPIWTEYVSLDSSPPNPIKVIYLHEYKTQLINISSELRDSYGITIRSDNAVFSSAEIAAEFILKDPLSEYSRAFHVLKSLNTETDTKIDTIKTDGGTNTWQSCIFKKPCYELYVYDKSRQLYETKNIVLSDNIIKIELRLPEHYLYQTSLKGKITELTDKDIQDKFISVYKRIMYNPFLKWYKQYLSSLNLLVSAFRNSHKRWISELYKYCSESENNYKIALLDWQDIKKCPCIASLDRRTQARIATQLEKVFSNTIFANNTYSQIIEVFHAVDDCCYGETPSKIIHSNKSLG